MPAPDVATLNQVTRPTATSEGQHAPALQFGDPRVMALMAAVTRFCHLITGFGNHTLVQLMPSLSGEDLLQPAGHLRLAPAPPQTDHLPDWLESTHRYQLTPPGRAVAVLFTKTYGRVLAPGLASLDLQLPGGLARRSPLLSAYLSGRGSMINGNALS